MESYFDSGHIPAFDHNKTNVTIYDLAQEYITEYKASKKREPGIFQILSEARKRVEPLTSQLVDYYETENYIFTHAWVPVNKVSGVPVSLRHLPVSSRQDWRNASRTEWDDARWSNPFEMADAHLQADKTIVCGHWHSSVGWARLEGRSEFGEDARFDPFYGEGFIAIDACTAYSGMVNVLIIEDSPLP